MPHANRLEAVNTLTSGGIAGMGDIEEAIIGTWSTLKQVLIDDRKALLSPSCLVEPTAQDRVLIYTVHPKLCIILAILERDQNSPLVLSKAGMLTFKSHHITLAAKKMRWAATCLLSSADDHYIVKDMQTETAKLKIAAIETVVRKATTTDDHVHGVLLQRLGSWLSDTAREVRMKAKQFLFE